MNYWHTVDGRDPAPSVDMDNNISFFIGFHGKEVVQDLSSINSTNSWLILNFQDIFSLQTALRETNSEFTLKIDGWFRWISFLGFGNFSGLS